MPGEQWTLVFFRSDNDRCPSTEFLASLDAADKARILNKLKTVSVQGPRYDDFSDQLTRDIWELRFYINDGIVRLFYFYQPNYTIVITNGMCKRKQKADPHAIALAERYMAEYLARK